MNHQSIICSNSCLDLSRKRICCVFSPIDQFFLCLQVKLPGSEGYDLEANLALIRIYVTQPEKAKIWLLGQILVKTMMQLPETDFSTVLHLIPVKMQVRHENWSELHKFHFSCLVFYKHCMESSVSKKAMKPDDSKRLLLCALVHTSKGNQWESCKSQ